MYGKKMLNGRREEEGESWSRRREQHYIECTALQVIPDIRNKENQRIQVLKR